MGWISGGSASWGNITGDIQDQTDLQEELSDSYLPLAGGTMTGTIYLQSNRGLEISQAGGWYIDTYGNFIHKSTDTSNYLSVNSGNGTAKVKVYYESGNTEISGTLTATGNITSNGSTVITQSTGDSRYLKLSGGTMTGTLTMGTNSIVMGGSSLYGSSSNLYYNGNNISGNITTTTCAGIKFWKIGRIVHYDAANMSTFAASTRDLGTLPSTFYPISEVAALIWDGWGWGNHVHVFIGTDGIIHKGDAQATTSGQMRGTGSYVSAS